MHFHGILDHIPVLAGSLCGEKVRFFREGVQSEPIPDIVADLELEFTPPDGEGEYRMAVRYRSNSGIARYSVLNWAGPNSPSLIYHHGSGETSYTALIRRLLPKSLCTGLNLFAVSIPWNRRLGEYIHGIGSLERFNTLVASSVRVFESLNRWLGDRGGGKTVAAGVSLGGFVTNLHFSLYGGMDEYRPIFAGAALDHLFTDTVYRNFITRDARTNPSVLRETMNFEELFLPGDTGRVYPLLARFDQYAVYEKQVRVYEERNVTTIEKGHLTGMIGMKSLRRHLLDGFR